MKLLHKYCAFDSTFLSVVVQALPKGPLESHKADCVMLSLNYTKLSIKTVTLWSSFESQEKNSATGKIYLFAMFQGHKLKPVIIFIFILALVVLLLVHALVNIFTY